MSINFLIDVLKSLKKIRNKLRLAIISAKTLLTINPMEPVLKKAKADLQAA
jgi:hypothetical protein